MATIYTRRVLIIIPAAAAVAANAWMKANVDPVGGENTFAVKLNADGDVGKAASHFWCSIALTEAQWTAVQAEAPNWGATLKEYDLNTELNTPVLELGKAGLKRVGHDVIGNG